MKLQHQHFSYFYPLLWTHLRGRSVSRSSQGPGWCCAVARGGLAVITSPRCHYQLFRPVLIWLLSDILFYHPPTQTQPLKSANNPSSSFPLFSLSWVCLCQVGQQSNSYPIPELCIDQDKSIIFLLYPLFEAQNAAYVTRGAGPGHVPRSACAGQGWWWWHLNNEKWERATCQHRYMNRILTEKCNVKLFIL